MSSFEPKKRGEAASHSPLGKSNLSPSLFRVCGACPIRYFAEAENPRRLAVATQFESVCSSPVCSSTNGLAVTTAMLVLLTAPFCGAQSARPAVHPFEAPPTLSETAASPGTLAQLAANRTVGRQICQPKGSITRDGNVVSVKLNSFAPRLHHPTTTRPHRCLRGRGSCDLALLRRLQVGSDDRGEAG